MGIFHEFVEEPDVDLIGVEAAGEGLESAGTPRRCRRAAGRAARRAEYLLQDAAGQVPPRTRFRRTRLSRRRARARHAQGQVAARRYVSVTDAEALDAFQPAQPTRGNHSGARERARHRLDDKDVAQVSELLAQNG
jgi:tryptophan synthase beta chain